MSKAISRFPVVGVDTLPEDLAARIKVISDKSGFVPNVFLAMAHRPDELRAFMDYHDALMEKPGGLSKAEREMIVVATSAANDCQYCVVAHGAILRIRAKNPQIADQVAVNWRKADLTPREAAMVQYAIKVALKAQEIGPEDHAALVAAGFTQDEIWDIGAITAFFGMSNRIVNMATIRPNDEFYSLGRDIPIKG
ncbi:peroxidase-related enzyme [Thioclava sp. FR2]|uniref:peroxidase-related enzyme n=1 Tax=Thioclava sp. FR2 TaxID=3445780 RepID=UPI003EBDBAD9